MRGADAAHAIVPPFDEVLRRLNRVGAFHRDHETKRRGTVAGLLPFSDMLVECGAIPDQADDAFLL